ncbi:hypothetical protein KBX49_11155 [Liquorilactobacillus satsumensis]|uniref:hypothetical protein n=1 Tax=Liquorilactobacillus satsumensis TaxID=259059 RepID=UPI0021C4BD19|nr:hypothetical protein [Liquorilactobacillus satsumensis]MCP9358515.1 hypothetical protein [Liquorilactobacillus satsumensis]MCP9372469.1 hypothetical protein [Liquorilactobacillus satsumensis]
MLYVEIVVPKPLRKLYLAIEYFNEADKEKCIEYFDLRTVVENSKFIIIPNCHNEFLKALSSEVLNVSGYYVDYTENIIGFEQKFKKINNHNTIGKYSEGTLEKTIKCLKEKSNNDSIEDWVSIKPLMEML